VDSQRHILSDLEESFKKAAAALRDAGIEFMVGGALASWVRGGPEASKDLDFMIRREDADRALEALANAGMKSERPPEGWLLKAWDGDILIDLIFHPIETPVTDELLARADELNVFAMRVRVMAAEDVLATKLLALNEHSLDFEQLLQIARALREQVDWSQVRARTEHSPYARGFFALLRELEVVPARDVAEPAGKRIRVLPGTAS
jgi:predicted nucleotidyltransferase